jgi:hypothetical protein
MQPFPIDKSGFLSLGLAVVLPMLPVILTEIPIADVLKALLKAAR